MLVSGAPDLSPSLLPMEVPVVIRTTVPSRGGISLLEPLAVSSLVGGGCWALITLLCRMMSQDTLAICFFNLGVPNQSAFLFLHFRFLLGFHITLFPGFIVVLKVLFPGYIVGRQGEMSLCHLVWTAQCFSYI